MREIKFRARAVETGEWVYFDLRDLNLGSYAREFQWDTACEHTGLKDKNGKEAFCKDICMTPYNKVGVIEWNNIEARFQINCEDDEFMGCVIEDSEIIGTVYENPELINNQ